MCLLGTFTHMSGIAAELAAAGFTDADEVGRGGSGVVYRCHQRSLGRSVAIKLLASDLDEDDRERFLREGYAMGALSGHPNIANILQVGVTESGRPFIVMPYHPAGSLADRVRREGRIGWPEVMRIGVKVCGGLETAHRTGTLHRDIKPANILVNDYGEPQLSDSGPRASRADTRRSPASSPALFPTPLRRCSQETRQRPWRTCTRSAPRSRTHRGQGAA